MASSLSSITPINSVPYILFQEDDTNFNEQIIKITINNPPNLNSWKAIFQLQHLNYIFNDISQGSFMIVISALDSQNIRIGICDGYIKFIDAKGRGQTYEKPIRFDIQKRQVRKPNE